MINVLLLFFASSDLAHADFESLYHEGKYEEIIQTDAPLNEENDANFFKGLACKGKGRLDDALFYLAKVEGRMKEAAVLNSILINLDRDDLLSALNSFEHLDADSEYYNKAAFVIAEHYYFKGLYKEAESLYKEIIERGRGEDYHTSLFRLGLINFFNSQYAASLTFLESYLSLKIVEKRFEAIELVADALAKLGEKGRASVYYERLLASEAHFRKAIFALMNINSDQKSFVFWVARALNRAIDRRDEEGILELIEYLEESRHYDAALMAIHRSENLFGDGIFSESQARILISKLEFSKALEVLKTIKEESDEVLYLKLVCYSYMGEYEKVIELAGKIESSGRLDSIQLELAKAYLKAGEVERALKLFVEVNRRGTLLKDSFLGIFQCMKELDRYDERYIKEYNRLPFSEYDYLVYDLALQTLLSKSDKERLVILIEELVSRESSDRTIRFILPFLAKSREYERLLFYSEYLSDESEKNLYKASAYINLENFDQGIAVLEKELRANFKEEVLYLMLEALICKRDYERALRVLDRNLHRCTSRYGEMLSRRAAILFEKGDYAEALKAYKKLPSSRESMLRIADSYFNLKLYEDASLYYLKLLELKDKISHSAAFSLALISQENGNHEKSDEYLQACLTFNNSDPEIYYLLFRNSLERGMLSLEYLERFFKLADESRVEAAISSIINLLKNKGINSEESIKLCSRANAEKTRLELFRSGYMRDVRLIGRMGGRFGKEALALLGDYYFDSQKYDIAYAYYDKLSKEDGYPSLYGIFGKSLVYLKRGEVSRAITHLQALALQRNDFMDRVCLALAEAYREVGDWESFLNVTHAFLKEFTSSGYVAKVLEYLIEYYLEEDEKEVAFSFYTKLRGVDDEVAQKYSAAFAF